MISAIVLRTQSDERLSALAADGSERAFEVIVTRYRRDLVAYCSRLLRSDSRGEDAVQQALLNAWVALRGGAGVRELKPWLYRIVYNQAISSLRRSGHDCEQLTEISDRSDQELDRRMDLRETLAAVAALPDLQRQAILQTSVWGESYEAAALTLGVSENALRGLVYRARQRVRAAVAAVTPFPLGLWAAQNRRRIGLVQWLGDLLPTSASTGGAAIGIKSVAALASSALIIGGGLVDRPPQRAVVRRSEHPTSSRRSTASTPTLRSASATATSTATSTAIAAHTGAAAGQRRGRAGLPGHLTVAASLVASSAPAAASRAGGRATAAGGRATAAGGRATATAAPTAATTTTATARAMTRAPAVNTTAATQAAPSSGAPAGAQAADTQAALAAARSPDQPGSAVASAASVAQPSTPSAGSSAESSQPQSMSADLAASQQSTGPQASSPALAAP
jgi:RNA polymerase sigma factor (sigma-70 family)